MGTQDQINKYLEFASEEMNTAAEAEEKAKATREPDRATYFILEAISLKLNALTYLALAQTQTQIMRSQND